MLWAWDPLGRPSIFCDSQSLGSVKVQRQDRGGCANAWPSPRMPFGARSPPRLLPLNLLRKGAHFSGIHSGTLTMTAVRHCGVCASADAFRRRGRKTPLPPSRLPCTKPLLLLYPRGGQTQHHGRTPASTHAKGRSDHKSMKLGRRRDTTKCIFRSVDFLAPCLKSRRSAKE